MILIRILTVYLEMPSWCSVILLSRDKLIRLDVFR